MNRVMRTCIGLLALIPVLVLAGWLCGKLGTEGETGAWTVFGVGVVWIFAVAWWALRAPAQLSDEARSRYLAFLRHAESRPLQRTDSDDTTTRR